MGAGGAACASKTSVGPEAHTHTRSVATSRGKRLLRNRTQHPSAKRATSNPRIAHSRCPAWSAPMRRPRRHPNQSMSRECGPLSCTHPPEWPCMHAA
eukprot:6038901-Prymnesium_polylepis.1